MITPQLLDYIKQQLGQGISKEQIKGVLLGQGWQEDDIEEGFRKVEENQISLSADQNNQIENNPTSNLPSNNDQNHSHQKLFWIGGIVVLIILAIIGGVFYFSPSKNVAQNQVNQNQNIQKTDNQKSNQGIKNQNQVNQAKTKVYSTKKLGVVPEYRWAGDEATTPRLIDKVISHDGQHLAYTVDIHHKCFVILDEQKQGGAYDYIGRPVFSPSSQHLAYVVKIGKQHFVILDRKKIKEYNRPIEVKHLIFSPDGQHLTYAVCSTIPSKDKYGKWTAKCRVVLDGKEQKKYDYEIERIIFSPDSQHLAYVVKCPYAVKSRERWFVVLDGKELKDPQGEISNLHFTKNYLNYNVVQDNGEVWFVSKKVN